MSMTAPPRCTGEIADDTVHRYVAGTLGEAEETAFEIHLLTCAACQAEVRTGAAIHATLRTADSGLASVPAWQRSRRVLRWALPAVAAAALLLVVLDRDGIEQLGGVADMPAFSPLPVRSSAAPAAQLADQGMAAYVAGDYRLAATRLAEAAALETSPGTSFFLGMSLLALDDATGAVRALHAALEPPDNAYAAEAHYYVAKAWLRHGMADSALHHLAAVPANHVLLSGRARALADSVRTRAP
ncbi:MAG TPA: zf-HC2 domain-containing protein [Longimicrobiales bacterium]|nr:zf-HC2 domain-containing protein [Longimicrobiales bacterium]